MQRQQHDAEVRTDLVNALHGKAKARRTWKRECAEKSEARCHSFLAEKLGRCKPACQRDADQQYVEQYMRCLCCNPLPGRHAGGIGGRRIVQAPGEAEQAEQKNGAADRNMQRGPERTEAIFSLDELLPKEQHEDQQRGDEPMQDQGNSVISGSGGSRHGSNPFQRCSTPIRQARPRFPSLMAEFWCRIIDLNQASR